MHGDSKSDIIELRTLPRYPSYIILGETEKEPEALSPSVHPICVLDNTVPDMTMTGASLCPGSDADVMLCCQEAGVQEEL